MKNWLFWERFLSVLQTLAIIAGVILILFAWRTIKHQEQKDSADIVIKFNDYFDQQKYVNLIDALDTLDTKVPIVNGLNGRKTKFSESLVYSYMSLFEMLDDLYKDKLVSYELIYENFSDNIKKAYQNEDIQFIIKRDRKEDATFWTGFQHLYEEFKRTSK